MDFFQTNKALLEGIEPDLARRLEKTSEARSNVRCFPSRKGPLTCKALGPHDRWVTLHSTVDPDSESATWMKAVDLIPQGILVLVGMGLGYPLWRLVEEADLEKSTVVLVERDLSLFRKSLELFDWSPFLRRPNINLLVGETEEQVLKHVTKIRMKRSFPRLQVIPHGSCEDFIGHLFMSQPRERDRKLNTYKLLKSGIS